MIKQTDPLTTYLLQKKEIDNAIIKVMESGNYILGEETKKFEAEFANYLCSGFQAIGVGSGTDALILALRTLNIGVGDSVITVSHTAVATVAAIELVGANPILVDVDEETMTINPRSVIDVIENFNKKEKGIKKQKNIIKAIIPVHLYGQSSNMSEIMKIAKDNELFVIEDCAQSTGAEYLGKKTGTIGDMAAFSFYPTKNLGAFGDGGALVSNKIELINKANMLKQYGWKERYISYINGMNSRLDEIQSAILRVRLNKLNEENNKRIEIAKKYTEKLKHLNLILPKLNNNSKHVFHQYVIRSKERDGLKKYLLGNDILTGIHYPVPVHLQPAYINKFSTMDLRVTEKISKEILSLPMHPNLRNDDIDYVSNEIQNFFNKS